LAGVAALWIGAWYWKGESPRWIPGLPFMAFAWWALRRAFPRFLPAQPEEPGTVPEVRPIPAIAALILAFAGTLLLAFHSLAWGLACLGGAALLAFFSGWRPAVPEAWGLRDSLALVLCLAVAAALRLPFLGSYFTGLQLDEANSLVDSAGVLTGNLRSPFRTVWGGNPSFTHFPLALFYLVFGQELWVARLLAALASLAAVFYFHRWIRLFTGFGPAAAVTFLFAVSWWHLFYALSPFHNIFQLALEIAALYHLERALRDGSREHAWWSGLLGAAAVMSYISGRLVPVIMAAVVLGSRLLSRRRGSWRTAAVMALGFLWLFGPFLHFIRESPHEFLARGQELNIFSAMAPMERPQAMKLFKDKVTATILSPNVALENTVDPRFNVPDNPFLDPVAGLFFVLGAAVLLRRPGNRFSLTFLSGTAVGYAANILSWWHFMPFHLNGHRYFFVLPFLLLGVAAGLAFAFQAVRRAWIPVARPLLVGALLFAVLWNAKVYFHDFRTHVQCHFFLGFPHLKVVEAYRQFMGNHQVVVDWRLYQSVHEFPTKGGLRGSVLQDQSDGFAWEKGKNVLFFLSTEPGSPVDRVRATFPRAHWMAPPKEWGRIYLSIAVVPARWLEGWNGRFSPNDRWGE